MLFAEFKILVLTAMSLGFFHTLLGADHYLPFIAIARANRWPVRKTFFLSLLAGGVHILSAVGVAIVGIMIGLDLAKFQLIESVRGNWNAWLLISFGLIYFTWGLRLAIQKRSSSRAAVTAPFAGFLLSVVILGPCEPLVPLFLYPALKGAWQQAWIAAAVFGGVTILTMVTLIYAGAFGFNFAAFKRIERYGHAVAGLLIFLCGMAVKFLGM